MRSVRHPLSGRALAPLSLGGRQLTLVWACSVLHVLSSTDDLNTFTLEVASGAPLDGLSMTGAWSMSRQLLSAYAGAFYTTATGAINAINGQVSKRAGRLGHKEIERYYELTGPAWRPSFKSGRGGCAG